MDTPYPVHSTATTGGGSPHLANESANTWYMREGAWGKAQRSCVRSARVLNVLIRGWPCRAAICKLSGRNG